MAPPPLAHSPTRVLRYVLRHILRSPSQSNLFSVLGQPPRAYLFLPVLLARFV